MSHLDPEQLALLALGEPVASPEEKAHLEECPACAGEVADLAHAAGVARSTVADGDLESPRTDVWTRIHDELHLDGGLAPDPLRSGAVPAGSAQPARRPRRSWWVLAAASALVLAVGGGIWAAIAVAQRPVIVATATLDAFPSHPDAAGSAEVDEDRSGARTLTITLDGQAASDEYREVWLIRADGEALISLGVLNDRTGVFTIPAAVDLAEYDLVDVSFEPVDGDPSHSGNSIVRGTLDFS
ncbi:anti-sigma factor [Microbacterium sp. CR_7]|uniref:anti-sigma factor n=1 Tax=Microbacterium sp. CR_7 TaxID=3055792 RepID=UPI0035C1A326